MFETMSHRAIKEIANFGIIFVQFVINSQERLPFFKLWPLKFVCVFLQEKRHQPTQTVTIEAEAFLGVNTNNLINEYLNPAWRKKGEHKTWNAELGTSNTWNGKNRT